MRANDCEVASLSPSREWEWLSLSFPRRAEGNFFARRWRPKYLRLRLETGSTFGQIIETVKKSRLTRQRFSVAAVLIYIHEWNDKGLQRWNIDHFNNFFELESAHELNLLKKAFLFRDFFFLCFCATFVDFSILS
jgi:hypothetical protein